MKVIDFSPTTSNTDVFQSWIFTNLRARLNITQTRLLLRIVELSQREIKGKVISRNMAQWSHTLNGVRVRMPLRSVMAENSKHYGEIRDAIVGLVGVVCHMWSDVNGAWRASGLISDVEIKPRSGMMEFFVADFVWDSILNFSKGFRRYELSKVLALTSPHSMRMYMLVSGQSRPISYKVDQLKALFGVENSYSQTSDFVKKVLRPSAEELAAKCPWSFTWSYIKEGRKVVAITIKPYNIPLHRDPELERKVLAQKSSVRVSLGCVYDYLRQRMGFSHTEIKPHEDLFKQLVEYHQDPMAVLADLNGRRRRPDGTDKGKAWIIGAVRGIVKMLVNGL